MPPSNTPVRRAKPLLGTFVAITVTGLPTARAHDAIDRGFAAVARVHGLMSFHEAGSDLARLNREAARKAVTVSPETFAVLSRALWFSAKSRGVFDVTVAGRLVAAGFLPRPASPRRPDPRASWKDIELLGRNRVRFHRPLWIDFGGIAKGYAVDRAVTEMELPEDVQIVVNAGGDLRVAGPQPERVLLQAPKTNGMVAVVELQEGSMASSSGREARKIVRGRAVGPHFDGRRRSSVGTRSFVSVMAPECITADALTKIVLANGVQSEALLRALGATAHVLSPGRGWRRLGAGE